MTMRILMLEDNPDDVGIIERVLKREGFDFCSKIVNKEQTFKDALLNFNPDIVLSDHALPSFNSKTALKICIKMRPHTPFILVTGAVSEEFAAEILKQGADDYILKSNLARLGSAILFSVKQRKLLLDKEKADRKLRNQKQKLEKLNKELDNFIYSLSHDLKAPLNSAIGLINLIFMEFNDQQAVRYYLNNLKNALSDLEVSLIELHNHYSNNKLDIVKHKINIKELVNDCLKKVEYVEGFDSLEKRIIINQNSVFYSDIYRIKLIFDNLISNAIKYRDPKKEHSFIEINITISDSLNVVFRDNGIGIHKNHIDKIFDMHYKGKLDHNSSGIGLYILKEAIEKLNGSISVKSDFTIGTTFFIEIPCL